MTLTPRPTLTYSEAERVGKALCTRWTAITGKKPPVMAGEAWADVVQMVMRRAGDIIVKRAETEGGQGEAE